MTYAIGIIVNLLTITKNERVGIRLADGAMRQPIVLLGYHARPPSEHPYPLAPRTEVGSDIAALEEYFKGGHAGRWHKVVHKPFPGIGIMLAQQRHQLLFGVVCGRQL